ncbi:hypothetical protein Vadar_026665 [Vaccinium darrowii]|uniref:Uncharacterized protein n=1 Tax=Vaccinium darrowii TaxID=229202 RepID=A0ACB7Z7D7_9ERIC|nr:hypothetical protein Vadar_026665 [Vaccinium darrowii]
MGLKLCVLDHENAFENVLGGEVIGGGSERGKGKGRGRELGTPTSDDWNVVAMYVEILRTFYIVTERLSGSLYVTCNTFYKEVTTVKNAIGKMELSDDPKLLMLAKGMHLKFDKCWGKFEKINQFLLYANVLDSRYKFEYVRWSLRKYLTEREVESKVVEIKEGMKGFIIGMRRGVLNMKRRRDQLDEIEELESVVMEAFEDSCVTEL